MYSSDAKVVRNTLISNGFKEIGSLKGKWSILWSGKPLKSNLYQNMDKYQKVNKFPRTNEITRKDLLYKHIARMQSSFGLRYFNFVPKSYILPQDSAIMNDEYTRNKKQMWIFKP